MVNVICKAGSCNYCSPSGFCQNRFVVITSRGFCGRIYDNNGRIKADWNQPIQQKEGNENYERETEVD